MLKRVTFSGGVRIADRRYAAKSATVTMKAPKIIEIKLTEKHKSLVSCGDSIKVGQLVAESIDEADTCPLFSPVSGTVSKIVSKEDIFGILSDFIIIENDLLDRTHEDIVPFNLSVKELDSQDIINIISVFGIPDTDGKPISAKLKTASNHGVKALIIGTGDSEGYVTADERLLYEHPDRVVNGTKLLMYALKIRSAIIAVEEDKVGAVNSLENEIDDHKMIDVRLMKAKYPQCIGRNLVSALFDEEIPFGQSLAENGYVTLSAQTVEDIFLAFYHGMPYTTRRITVCGEGINKQRNINVPVGTTVKDIITFCNGLKNNCDKIVAGGAMRGRVIVNTQSPIEPTTNAIIAIGKCRSDYVSDRHFCCINCGRCVQVCPSAIKPNYILQAIKCGNINACSALDILKCNNCSCCSYVCPQQIPLSGIISDTVIKHRVEIENGKQESRNDTPTGENKEKSVIDCIIDTISKSNASKKDDGGSSE